MTIKKRKILIVDDDPISLHRLADYLREGGYNYTQAENGKKAWEMLQQTPEEFALVVADRIMPGFHGIELLAHMQKYPLLKNIPVLLLTGVADKEEMIEAFKVGVYDFLYKPVEKDLLYAVLKKVLKSHAC